MQRLLSSVVVYEDVKSSRSVKVVKLLEV